MPTRTPEQIEDQSRICGCDHFRNDHAGTHGKCLFVQLQAVFGNPGHPECPCLGFVEDEGKTVAHVDGRERLHKAVLDACPGLRDRKAIDAKIGRWAEEMCQGPKVVIVWCRKAVEGRFDDVLAHVASSWETAEVWIKKSLGWCGNDRLWWWFGHETGVDGEWTGRHRFFDRNGVEHDYQKTLVLNELRSQLPIHLR